MTTSSGVSSDVPSSGSSSSSSIVAGAVSGYHLLKIDGYSRTKQAPNGKKIDSSQFQIGGRTWHVYYYPNGDATKNSDFISIFLKLDDTVAEPVKGELQFSLLDQHRKPYYTRISDIKDFAVGNNSWGFANFIKRVDLEKSELLKDDSFTIKVGITIMSDFHAVETPSIVLPPYDLHRLFGDLLSSKTGLDVEFRVCGDTFSAHRSLLAACSPVFRAQLYGLMKEGSTTNAIHIDDMEAGVFSALLTFLYTDALPDMKQEEESAMVQHLLVAADRYDLERLKLMCESKLCKHINTSSVATILALADQHHCHKLKAACLVFLSSPTNLDEAVESEGFEFLTKSCPGVMKDFLKYQVVPSLLGKRKSGP
ncbi:unnamed protein product [Alopecurus aequalis]